MQKENKQRDLGTKSIICRIKPKEKEKKSISLKKNPKSVQNMDTKITKIKIIMVPTIYTADNIISESLRLKPTIKVQLSKRAQIQNKGIIIDMNSKDLNKMSLVSLYKFKKTQGAGPR